MTVFLTLSLATFAINKEPFIRVLYNRKVEMLKESFFIFVFLRGLDDVHSDRQMFEITSAVFSRSVKSNQHVIVKSYQCPAHMSASCVEHPVFICERRFF